MGVLKTEKLEGGVALMTINKPDRMNAWSADLGEDFFEALNKFSEDPEVRCIVLTGEGRAFCAGADAQGRFDEKSETQAMKEARLKKEEMMKGWKIKRFHDMGKMHIPIIAAINGGCVGIGLSMALHCDMRFAAKDAKIGVIFPQRGLIAEDGMGYFLPHLVGTGNAMMMLLTGDVMAAEDIPPGMIQKLYPKEDLLKETLAFAKRLAVNSSPTAVAVMKQQAYLYPQMSFMESQRINDQIQTESVKAGGNPDTVEGFASFGEKRAPKFAPYNKDVPYAKIARELLSPHGSKL